MFSSAQQPETCTTLHQRHSLRVLHSAIFQRRLHWCDASGELIQEVIALTESLTENFSDDYQKGIPLQSGSQPLETGEMASICVEMIQSQSL